MPDENPAPASVTSEPAPAESASTAVTPEAETQSANAVSSSLMDRMGIPAEAQQQLKELKSATEPEPETPEAETPTAEAEQQSVESPETPVEQEASEEQPEAHTDWPESAKKRVAKLSEQKRKAKEKADELEEKLEQVTAQLENVQPVTIAPHSGDLLADVQNEQQLNQRVEEARLAKAWCLKHLATGATVNEGTDNEQTITPEEVADRLALVDDMLTVQAPRKHADIQQRRQYDGIAKQHYAPIFDRGSEDYQVASALVQQLPGLANHPAKNLILGDYIEGVRARLAKAKPNGKSQDIPPELRRPIPPIAPPVPAARSNGSAPSPQKKKEQAMNNLANSDGSREYLVNALRARREARSTSSSARDLVAV